LNLFKSLFKQTAIYGIATVLPRMASFFLVRLHTDPKIINVEEFGQITNYFAYVLLMNVVLSYGMETAFFKFYHSESNKNKVTHTAALAILVSTILFLFLALIFRVSIANYMQIDVDYVTYFIWILALDALVVIPFSILRANKKPMKYAFIKIISVVINLLLNLFLLKYLPQIFLKNPNSYLASFYVENFQIGYILVANIVASLFSLLALSPLYFSKFEFDKNLLFKMLKYGFPILIAGLAFGINEHLDKILLKKLNVSDIEIGIYGACYKLGLFMVLFRTAYTLGIEPFFFSHAKNENAPQTYADITKYFVITGSLLLLIIVVLSDFLKIMFIKSPEYWTGMKIVPIILVANFFLGIYTNLSIWYKLINKTIVGALISIVGATITIVFNLVLIPKIGYMGSAITTVVAYFVMMLISYLLGQKKYPIPYDIKAILFYLLSSIALSGFYFYGIGKYHFRENYWVGFSLIGIFIIIILKKEKSTLTKIFKNKSSNL
jgi:O-antigen/teichoic acid export membrane protein